VDYSTLDDSTLIRLIAHAKTDALSELYNRYFRQVFGLALAVIKDRELAEEITQDVFLRVWAHAKSYQGGQAKANVWLMRIARNRAIDVFRGRKAHPEQQAIDLEYSPVSERTSHDTPQTALELTLQKERIQAAVAQLPDEQQRVVSLMYFQGYTQQEIADLLKTPLGTIKTRARLAMLKLRELLQDEDVVKSTIE
jgi:RNA polymerase sigma-70 factor (ECF subfamily)